MQGLSWCVCLGGVSMAKEWAKGFYKCKAWQRCREGYIQSVMGLCERCGAGGKIVHHIVELTPESINNPEVSLNWNNLELLCQDCHNEHHHGGGSTTQGIRFDEDGNVYEVKPL